MSTMLKKNGFQHSQCVVSKQHVGLYVELKQTNVESKLLLQLFWAEGQTENTCAWFPSERAHSEFGRAVHHDDSDCWQG